MIKYICCAICVATLTLLLSCGRVSEKPIPSFRTASSAEITSVILADIPSNSIIPTIMLSDARYILPTEAWVRREFTAQLDKFLFDYNVRFYGEEKNDCDKFSLYGRAIANILNRHNPNNRNTGIAVGQVSIVRGVSGHSINFMVVADNFGTPKIIYYEPQTLQVINLDDYSSVKFRYDL